MKVNSLMFKVFFFHCLGSLETLFEAVGISECEIGSLIWFMVKGEVKTNKEPILSIIEVDVRWNSFPCFLSIGKDPINWFEACFVKFTLVVHSSDTQIEVCVFLNSLNAEVEPCSVMACLWIRQRIFRNVYIVSILIHLDTLSHISWVKATWESDIIKNKGVLLRMSVLKGSLRVHRWPASLLTFLDLTILHNWNLNLNRLLTYHYQDKWTGCSSFIVLIVWAISLSSTRLKSTRSLKWGLFERSGWNYSIKPVLPRPL